MSRVRSVHASTVCRKYALILRFRVFIETLEDKGKSLDPWEIKDPSGVSCGGWTPINENEEILFECAMNSQVGGGKEVDETTSDEISVEATIGPATPEHQRAKNPDAAEALFLIENDVGLPNSSKEDEQGISTMPLSIIQP